MSNEITPLGDSALAGRPVFQKCLADMSPSTFYRDQRAGKIPEPDGWVGGRAVWKISTIKRTVEEYLASEKPRTNDIPRPGRPRKTRTTTQAATAVGGAQ